jgi:hypothetical protein
MLESKIADIPNSQYYLKSTIPGIQNFTTDFKYGRSPRSSNTSNTSSES